MTSHDVVSRVRRCLPRKTKVGHLGTLDPDATGVLPVAVGSATKLIPHLPNLGESMKSYFAEIELGITTSTDDVSGEILDRADPSELATIGEAQVARELRAFQGIIQQIPPQVSAVRSDGERAYARARRGETVVLKARELKIARCELKTWSPGPRLLVELFIVCSSGTYIRSIARDLGAQLGVGGALSFLIRTHSGPFELADSKPLEALVNGGVEGLLLPCEFPFLSLPEAEVSDFKIKGDLVTGDLPPGDLLRTKGALLRPTQRAGEAKVEALLEALPRS